MQGLLVSGTKDGNIFITNASTGEVQSNVNIGVAPRALDLFKGSLLAVGTRDGAILEFDMANQGEPNVYMQGHDTGEAWGLDLSGDKFVTSGDDNKVMLWNPETRRCENTAVINTESRGAKRNKAGT